MRYALVLFVICLGFGSGSLADAHPANTRKNVIAGMTTVLKFWDKNGDGKLSRAEVAAMTDEFFRRLGKDLTDDKRRADLQRQRQEFLGFYASQDTNGDGYLTLGELLTGPLATFDCMDANHDRKVSDEEVLRSFERCPSVNFDDYAPKP